MTTQRPRKPWRVVSVHRDEKLQEEFTSERAAYDHVIEQRQKAQEGAITLTDIQVHNWEDGRWGLFEDGLNYA
ncbi:hypothetical protein [Streptomyces sp. NPDC048611]|uniref:hypothetical protein n=1 Tax=Streptomyces sp. NPDC048611 TaxID=3155635 RepID=UPI00342DA642